MLDTFAIFKASNENLIWVGSGRNKTKRTRNTREEIDRI